MSYHFYIYYCLPFAIGVGVALTLAAKGDQALSLFLTVVSNMLGIVTIPFLLQYYVGGIGVVTLNPSYLFFRLIPSVFIPSIVGIWLRNSNQSVADFMKTYKTEMGLFSNSNLICIVLLALSDSRTVLLQQRPGEIVMLVIAAVLMHLFYLSYNYLIIGPLGFNYPLKQAISVIIMASQKSSPVGLAVIANITQNPTQFGLLALPCILGQVSQIFIGSFVSQYFVNMVKKQENESMSAASDSTHQYGLLTSDPNKLPISTHSIELTSMGSHNSTVSGGTVYYQYNPLDSIRVE